MLDRVSHGFNTFPSGHVAVSISCALGAADVNVAMGGVVSAVAVAITAGAVAGRYHFVIDVVLGAAVAGVFAVLVPIAGYG